MSGHIAIPTIIQLAGPSELCLHIGLMVTWAESQGNTQAAAVAGARARAAALG